MCGCGIAERFGGLGMLGVLKRALARKTQARRSARQALARQDRVALNANGRGVAASDEELKAALKGVIYDWFGWLGRLVAYVLQVLLFVGAGAFALWMYVTYVSPREKPSAWTRPAADWRELADWIAASDPAVFETRAAEARSFVGVAFDQMALCAYYAHAEPNEDFAGDALLFCNLAAAKGDQDARRLRAGLSGVSVSARDYAVAEFIAIHESGGRDGLYQLGQYYLGDAVKGVADAGGVDASVIGPNDYLKSDPKAAYEAFALAAGCGEAAAIRFQDGMRKSKVIVGNQTAGVDAEVANLVKAYRDEGVWNAFCAGGLGRPAPVDGASLADLLGRSQGRTPFPFADADLGIGGGDFEGFAEALGRTLEEGRVVVLALSDPDVRRQLDAAARDGAPAADETFNRWVYEPLGSGEALRRADALGAANWARFWLRAGEAMQSVGRIESSKFAYEMSVRLGRNYYAQAARVASERLRALTLTCQYTERSLQRIDIASPDYDLIDLRIRQQALQALGYYTGDIDGAYGPGTRGAVRQFQRTLGFDETDALSPLQTVSLVCNAAENKGDAASQNALGVMYALGLGVRQNTDLALDWLRRAADQGYGEAYYNLALIFGSERIASSYRLCDVPEDQARAEEYWRQAGRLGVAEAERSWKAFRESRAGRLPQRGTYDDKTGDRQIADGDEVCVDREARAALAPQ